MQSKTSETPEKSYAGACWNELMYNETKESLAKLYIDQLDKNRRLTTEIEHLQRPYFDPDLNEVRKSLNEMTDREYIQYSEYCVGCRCQRCWESAYVLRIRRELRDLKEKHERA